MNLPANIRVNAQLPFPAMVTGTGPITIGKVNGIWQVGFTINAFGTQNPPSRRARWRCGRMEHGSASSALATGHSWRMSATLPPSDNGDSRY